MTPDQRRQAILAKIAADLAIARADRVLKSCVKGKTPQTAGRVLEGKNHTIETLVDVADALDCDVVILITKRTAA